MVCRSSFPTTLGVALIEGYDNMGFEISLAKPFLRKEVRIVDEGRVDGKGLCAD